MRKKDVAAQRRAQESLPTIATARDEVAVTAALDAPQTFWHGEIILVSLN